MILSCEFFFDSEKIESNIMLENGKIKVFVNYNERIYDVNFFINSFPFLKKIYAFSQYYKLQMKDDIKKFYDGNEIE